MLSSIRPRLSTEPFFLLPLATVFRDVQRVLPSCVLRTFGYVSRSEKKLQKRLNKLAELDKKAALAASPRNSTSRPFSGRLWSPKTDTARPSSPSFALGAAPTQRRSSNTVIIVEQAPNPSNLLTLPDKVRLIFGCLCFSLQFLLLY
jgi:hypothetical protein